MKNYVKKIESEHGYTLYLNKKGKFHRVDGPAVEFNGDREYYFNGKLHREDGPAFELKCGSGRYYLYGRWFFKEEFTYIVKYREKYNYNI